MEAYHVPALLEETVQLLEIKPGGRYVDVTLGGGGHTRALLQAGAFVTAFDQDADALAEAGRWSEGLEPGRLTLVHGNFRFLSNYLRFLGQHGQVDGLLADLGVSFHHFDTPERGFSFRFDGPLDMRMNRQAPLTAADVANNYDTDQLARLLRLYGEVGDPRRVARAIEAARPLATVEQLAQAVEPVLDPRTRKQDLSKIFQALRIEVNDEMGALNSLLTQAVDALAPGGRLAVLTYHSLEDRLVKNFMRTGNIEGRAEADFFGRRTAPLIPVNRKPVTASAAEVEANPRARSAKLRVARKAY